MSNETEIWSKIIFPKDQRKDIDMLDLSTSIFKSDSLEIEIIKIPLGKYLKCLAALEAAEKQIEGLLLANSASGPTM